MTKKRTPNSRTALLLGGGGARAAYQVGVLKAIAEITANDSPNPFPIICGTSAGSINASALASNADDFHLGVKRIVNVWSNFKLSHVFYADAKNLAKRIFAWGWTHIGFGKAINGPPSLLDNQPLSELLEKTISFKNIDQSIKSGNLHAYCITACSYSSGESTSFFDGHSSIKNWQRTHREGRRVKLNIDHLMASSAIPVIFPSIKIGNEYFGDGSMRQNSPISPAVHLGADKILIIGLRLEARQGVDSNQTKVKRRPTLGQISGYVLDTLFLNSLSADVERLERLNKLLKSQQAAAASNQPLKVIEHLIISPSQDIADIAIHHYKTLPKSFRIALMFVGMTGTNSRRFISYLMFVGGFCRELISLGYRDAMAQKSEIQTFLEQ